MGEYPPLGDEKKFDPLNQPAICFLLLVPYINVCKIISPECTKTHHFDIKNQKKFFSNSTFGVSFPLKLNPGYAPVSNYYIYVYKRAPY